MLPQTPDQICPLDSVSCSLGSIVPPSEIYWMPTDCWAMPNTMLLLRFPFLVLLLRMFVLYRSPMPHLPHVKKATQPKGRIVFSSAPRCFSPKKCSSKPTLLVFQEDRSSSCQYAGSRDLCPILFRRSYKLVATLLGMDQKSQHSLADS